MEVDYDGFLDLIFRNARSRNSWSNRPVADETMRTIYNLAKLGPTSANTSPARFVWVRSAAEKDKLAACASVANRSKILAAPVTVIIARDLKFAVHLPKLFPHAPQMHSLMENPVVASETARRNATLQGAYLIIAARALGLDCGPMSGFDAALVNGEFFPNQPVEADFLCSIGYGSDDQLFERLPRLEFEEANTII